MIFPTAKRSQGKTKARQSHEHGGGKSTAKEPDVVPGSKSAVRGEKNIERMALHHQDHGEYPNQVCRNQARGGFERQAH
jgi:hypothetical protein